MQSRRVNGGERVRFHYVGHCLETGTCTVFPNVLYVKVTLASRQLQLLRVQAFAGRGEQLETNKGDSRRLKLSFFPTSGRCTLQLWEAGCGSVLSRSRSSDIEEFGQQTRRTVFRSSVFF